MGKIIFVIGGARSGKSALALKLVPEKARAAFLATGEPKDKEMSSRIALHKNKRPASWTTFEVPVGLSALLKEQAKKFDVVIIDCLTLLVSNMMLKGHKEKAIEHEILETLRILKKARAQSIIVSNEVGFGIVPVNRLARNFRDIAGRVNQIVASESAQVYLTVCGIPWRIK